MSFHFFVAAGRRRRRLDGGTTGGSELWRPDLNAGSAQNVFKYDVVERSSGITFPTDATSTDPSGRVYRIAVPGGTGTADAVGAKWRTKWAAVPLAAAQDRITSMDIRFPSGLPIHEVNSKQAWGLAGQPESQGGWYASTGGTKRIDSWSVRWVTIEPNWLAWKLGNHPTLLALYVYAVYANGEALTQYGIEIPLRTGLNGKSGTFFSLDSPANRDRWLNIAMRVKMNTPGVRNGLVEAWVDGVKLVSVGDVLFNQNGYDQPINLIISDTFFQEGLSAGGNIDHQNMTILDPAGTAEPAPEPVADKPVEETTVVDFTDTFTGSFHAGWTGRSTAVVINSDRAVLPVSTAWPFLSTDKGSAVGKELIADVVTAPTGTQSSGEMRWHIDESNYVGFIDTGSNLVARERVGGTSNNVAVTRNLTTAGRRRIRHDAATNEVVWETAAYGSSTWTEVRRKVTALPLGDVQARFIAGTWGTDTGEYVLDNVTVRLGAESVTGLPRLKVTGGRITDLSGNPVLLRGANIHKTEWVASTTFDKTAIARMASNWQGNVVHYGFATAPVNRGEAGYLGLLDDLVATCRANKVYIVFSARWAERNTDPQFQGIPPTSGTASATGALQALAGRYKNEPHVLYGAQVETNGTGVSDDTLTSWQNIRPYYEACVSAVHAGASPNKPIVMTSGTSWGRTIKHAVTNPVAGENVVYKTHVYGPWDGAEGHLAKHIGTAHSSGLPVWLGEFGWNEQGMTLTDTQALLAWCQSNNVGWAAWLLSYETGAALVTDSTAQTPTDPYGVTVRDAMLLTPAVS